MKYQNINENNFKSNDNYQEEVFPPKRHNNLTAQDFGCDEARYISWYSGLQFKYEGKSLRIRPRDGNKEGIPNIFLGEQIIRDETLLKGIIKAFPNTEVITLDLGCNGEQKHHIWQGKFGWTSSRINN